MFDLIIFLNWLTLAAIRAFSNAMKGFKTWVLCMHTAQFWIYECLNFGQQSHTQFLNVWTLFEIYIAVGKNYPSSWQSIAHTVWHETGRRFFFFEMETGRSCYIIYRLRLELHQEESDYLLFFGGLEVALYWANMSAEFHLVRRQVLHFLDQW
jgi:hypothetical protein